MFCFAMPIFFKGRKQTLDQTDLYRALNEHKSASLAKKLHNAWDKELLKKEQTNKDPQLLNAVWRVFGLQFSLLGLVGLLMELGLRLTQPIFLGGLVSYYSKSNNTTDQTEAYLYAMGVILCTALNILILHPYSFGITHIGMKMRLAVSSLIYRKTLRLSKTALGNTTSGQALNLISNDVGRMDLALIFINYFWIAPLEVIVATYLMYLEIGVSALFGVAAMIVFLPFQMWLGKKTSVLRLRTALRTDERVRMMNEIISGIQVIKMYAWEIPFGKMVQFTRLREMKAIRYVNYIRGTLMSFMIFMTRVSIFASLVGYVLLGNFLTAQQAFVITAYFNLLRTTVTMFFPMAIQQTAELQVSFKRIEKYLLYEETKVSDTSEENDIANGNNRSNVITAQPKYIDDDDKPKGLDAMVTFGNGKNMEVEPGIEICNLKAKWNNELTEYTLDDVSLSIKPRTLVAVIGPVGSGKSSLIETILGELPAESGSITTNGKFSYASQEPWLFTGSVRQNILFGLPMDRHRYRTVVQKCALERDFELFPHGDKTIVGERGASLSGGQKARISLARAVYRKSDIYLLDDPLSAVDTHVGRHLFDQCMRGFLRDKIVLLVTHQLQFLEQADIIVIMDKGKISAVGTYESMHKSGLDFAKLLTDPEMRDESTKDNDKKSLSHQSSKMRERLDSVSSMSSYASTIVDDSPMQVQETRVEGKVGFKHYQKYFGDSKGYIFFITLLAVFLIVQVLGSGGDFFLSYWVNKNENEVNSEGENAKTDPVDIYIFSGLTVGTVIFTVLRTILFYNLAFRSSTAMHNEMFKGIIRASMYFFSTNPSGRVLNRFSKDMGQVDEILPSVMMDVLQIFLGLAGIVIVTSIINPWFLLATILMSIIFYFLRQFYLKTSRDIKRLEAVARSPIYSHMGASLKGLSTIRAFGAQKVLIAEFDNYQDTHSSCFYLVLSTTRAFGYWLDLFSVLYIAIVTLSFFVFAPENGGEVGLAITQAMGMIGMVQYGMRQSAELENTMTAVERVSEYKEIEPEGEFESKPDKKPPATWPEKGQVIFDDLSLRYFPDPKSTYVLKSLNFEIKPCEKVGIVGRTGAGKSSLINALFRLSYNNGSILIDKRDTQDLGLHDLRSKISIIPQEPVLFSGTMRYNLDPFDEYSDAKLWEALEEVKLKSAIAELPTGLQSKISEGGSNFSVGQRQLVCLARALLRENRILVLDEATANVDPQTDALIQTTIRNKFRECTVLTIAHRLHTVMDSDKVLVMDAGRAVEFGTPYELLTESKTKIFHGMVKQTGDTTFETLLNVAKKAYEERQRHKKDV